MNKQFIKMLVTFAITGIIMVGFSIAHADMNSYRLYNTHNGEHFWTTSLAEKQSLVTAGWRYEEVAWSSASSGKTAIFRVYNPNSGEHFYTTSTIEEKSLIHVGWRTDGTLGYSGGSYPVYRLYDGKTHFYTINKTEKNSLAKTKGWSYEGIAFYSHAPEYNWHYDVTEGADSGHAGDVHFPQFYYFTSTQAVTKTYSGNDVFYAYNDTAFNFNAQLQADAKSADYANEQARVAWSTTQNKDALAVADATAEVAADKTKIGEATALVKQANADVTADTQHNLDATNDNALLAKYKTALASAQSAANADNTTCTKAKNALDTLNKQGTDYVKLGYIVSLSNNGETATVNFTETTKKGTSVKKTTFSRSATLWVK
ncbi:hypothetical protein ACFO26_10165 [Lactococcus nasutitermitis]|uniref:DUF5648 domain-containing protein n=1 Tax=Lactococcus nasutitermitis TaxID=1652957 RepID=A0ABV9JIR9_9LACT|nr:hypothetical protein [Lactococcus nasutitermitis]